MQVSSHRYVSVKDMPPAPRHVHVGLQLDRDQVMNETIFCLRYDVAILGRHLNHSA